MTCPSNAPLFKAKTRDDREYQLAKSRRFYERNRSEQIENSVERNRQKRRKFYQFIRRYKMLVGCSICGYRKCHKALEFHHTGESEKDDAISRMKHRTMKVIKYEMRKCIVVCANCHRELHFENILS